VCVCDIFRVNSVIVAFSALTLLVGRQEGHPACKKLEWWDSGVVICLGRGADLCMAQLMPLPLTVSWIYLPGFYCTMHCGAKRGLVISCRLSVPLSVRLSVTLVDHDHVG